MKKILALLTVSVLLLCIIFSASAEDSVHDPTYRFLYSNLLSALESPDSPDTGLLKAETATVWNSSNDLAGFLFEGQDWSIRGEADKKTGIITRILCRFPYILKLKDLVLMEKIDQKDIDSGVIYDDVSVADRFAQAYDFDDRDLYCLVSFYGNEPLVLELARRAKEKGQKVVGVVNRKSYDAHNGKLLDYCDLYLDMGADEPDLAIDLEGTKVGQLSSTVSNVTAQMLTAELYRYFTEKGKEAPVLLSANVKGADLHNNSLTDPYGRRIR